jgi:hypothetical protein
MSRVRRLLPVRFFLALPPAGPALAPDRSFQGSAQHFRYTGPLADNDRAGVVRRIRSRAGGRRGDDALSLSGCAPPVSHPGPARPGGGTKDLREMPSAEGGTDR